MKKRIEGIVVPVITPLNHDGTVDRDAAIRHHNYLIEKGVAGIFVLGTTGGGPAVADYVQKEMIVTSVHSVAKRVPLLVGISSASLQASLDLARFAAAHGADGVVLAPPCYLPMEGREIVEYYRIVASEQPLPVYIYNMPAMTKINMPPELILEIAKIDNIAGYKDSAGDFNAFKKVCTALKDREDFSLFMGPDHLMGDAVAIGACGGVNSGANLAPEIFVNRRKAELAGNREEAAKWQKWIEDLQVVYKFRENICCGVAAGLVKALNLLGICQNENIRPWAPMEDHQEITDFVNALQAMRKNG